MIVGGWNDCSTPPLYKVHALYVAYLHMQHSGVSLHRGRSRPPTTTTGEETGERNIYRRDNTGERGDWVSFRDLWTYPIKFTPNSPTFFELLFSLRHEGKEGKSLSSQTWPGSPATTRLVTQHCDPPPLSRKRVLPYSYDYRIYVFRYRRVLSYNPPPMVLSHRHVSADCAMLGRA